MTASVRHSAPFLALALVVSHVGVASAMPLLDTVNQDATAGSEQDNPDAQDLDNLFQVAGGIRAPHDDGWTIVPRIDLQEELTDNVYQQHSPRDASLVTYIAPGVTIAGDTSRLKLNFDFSPTLAIYIPQSSLAAVTEQLTGIASVTVVPDWAYVDLRAVSGVHSVYGGLGGLGTLGSPSDITTLGIGTTPVLAGNDIGLTKDNSVQTSSFGLSPYLLRHLGDWGNVKAGYSLDVSSSNYTSGFVAAPFPIGGSSEQTLVTNEEFAHYDTGNRFGRLQNSIDVDLSQSQINTGTGFSEVGGVASPLVNGVQSRRSFISDQVTYQVNRNIAVFASGGHENISYSLIGFHNVSDMTWSLGTTLTPNGDSQLTVSYGHLYGVNTLTVDGRYQATARTVLTASYGTSLGTQLEMVQSELGLASAGRYGGFMNGRTSGPLFADVNALPVENDLFRTTSLTIGAQTTLRRDVISLYGIYTKQTSVTGSVGYTTDTEAGNITWLHQIRPRMLISASVSLAVQGGDTAFTGIPGSSTSEVVSFGWQCHLTETLIASARYAFLARQSDARAYDVYQNLLIAGVTKTF